MKHQRKPEDGIPVLIGVIDQKARPYSKDDLIVKAWCPYCLVYHSHGIEKTMPSWAITHRVAHCYKESPFCKTGYYIRRERKSDY
jgi:hypothetical protein